MFEVTNRCSTGEIISIDDHVAPAGRVMEMLSEHQCEGWLEGYLLTGRHGFFSCYEAFIHIVDSMFNQHAKWLKVTNHIPWRRPIASLNYLLSSHVWRQDHNGFSHQDPGFMNHEGCTRGLGSHTRAGVRSCTATMRLGSNLTIFPEPQAATSLKGGRREAGVNHIFDPTPSPGLDSPQPGFLHSGER